MIPKLTDDAVSMLPLESGRAELLEEIMSTVAPDRQNAEPTRLAAPRRTRWLAPAGRRPRSSPAWPAAPSGGSSTARRRTTPTTWRPRSASPRARPWCSTPRAGRSTRSAATASVPQRRRRPRDHVVRRQAVRLLRHGPGAHRRPAGSRCADPGARASGADVGLHPTDHTAIREVEDGTGWSSGGGDGPGRLPRTPRPAAADLGRGVRGAVSAVRDRERDHGVRSGLCPGAHRGAGLDHRHQPPT